MRIDENDQEEIIDWQLNQWRKEISELQAKIDENTPKPEKHPELKDCMKVGNKVWFVRSYCRDITGCEVEVLKVGRIWVSLSNRWRCNKSGVVDGSGYIYTSQKAYQDKVAREKSWSAFKEKLNVFSRMPKILSMQDLSDICAKLGFDDVTRGEK